MVLFLLGIPGFFILMSCAAAPVVQSTETPGPKARAALELAAQAGKSDGVVLFGILIFVFIAIPIILRYRQIKNAP